MRRSMQSSSASYHHSVDNHTSPWGPAGNTQFLARGQCYSVLCPQWFHWFASLGRLCCCPLP